jgi:transcriptional regulator with XRE-family HTH domain
MRSEPPVRPALLRELIGESLREERVAQGKTLREVSKAAQVSLGYLSEVERGQKEASSELLAAMCAALDLPLSVVLNLVSEKLAMVESAADGRVTTLPRVRALAQARGLIGPQTGRRAEAQALRGHSEASLLQGLADRGPPRTRGPRRPARPSACPAVRAGPRAPAHRRPAPAAPRPR